MSISHLRADKGAKIDRIGFGGLLLLATKDLRYKLIQWLISAYDVPYHRIIMDSSAFVDVTLRDVEATMAIPCDGLVIPIHLNRVTRGTKYTIGFVESQFVSLLIDEEFIVTQSLNSLQYKVTVYHVNYTKQNRLKHLK